MASDTAGPRWSVAPYFKVVDVVAAANFYRDRLRERWDPYIWVNDADALISEYRRKGVRILRDICDQPYGCRDFDMEDCNGYRLCFGHTLERTG